MSEAKQCLEWVLECAFSLPKMLTSFEHLIFLDVGMMYQAMNEPVEAKLWFRGASQSPRQDIVIMAKIHLLFLSLDETEEV